MWQAPGPEPPDPAFLMYVDSGPSAGCQARSGRGSGLLGKSAFDEPLGRVRVALPREQPHLLLGAAPELAAGVEVVQCPMKKSGQGFSVSSVAQQRVFLVACDVLQATLGEGDHACAFSHRFHPHVPEPLEERRHDEDVVRPIDLTQR